MKLPVISGVIDRRILANFRVDADVLTTMLPQPFRPQLVNGYGIAGICLIRLKHVRPRLMPALVGLTSENAAHRIAVEWDEHGKVRTGVYVPRRDTSNWLNVIAGGRIFPGIHHRAKFSVHEDDTTFHLTMQSHDGVAHVAVDASTTSELPSSSVFASVQQASQFFEAGSLGYSPASTEGEFDGLELHTVNWSVRPMKVSRIESSYFDNRQRFPRGSVEFDHALLMRDIDHTWQSRASICCADELPKTSWR